MLNLERILQNDRLMRAMTGLNRKAFENLLPSFSQAYQQPQMQSKDKRQRAQVDEKRLYGQIGTSSSIFCSIASAIQRST